MINLFFTLASAILGIAMFGTILFTSERPESKSVAGIGDAGVDELFGTAMVAKQDAATVIAEFVQTATPAQRRPANGATRPNVGTSTLQMAAQISGGVASRPQQMSGRA
jgi:hypothetical protein